MARPRKPDHELHDEVLKLRLTPDQYSKLQAIAKAKDMPIAVIGRSILIDALAEYLRVPNAA
jgi:hypothetical protein